MWVEGSLGGRFTAGWLVFGVLVVVGEVMEEEVVE